MPSFSFTLGSSSSIRDPGRHSHYASEPCRSPGALGCGSAAVFPHVCECLGKVLPQGSQYLLCRTPAPGLIKRNPPGATLTSPTCGQIWGVFLCCPWFIFPDLLVIIQEAAGSPIQMALEYILSFWGPGSLVWKLGQLGSLPELRRVLHVPRGLQGGFIQGLRGLPPGLRGDRKWCPWGPPAPTLPSQTNILVAYLICLLVIAYDFKVRVLLL